MDRAVRIGISTSVPVRLSRMVSVSSATRGTLASSSSIAMVDPPIVWTPSPERIASATITRYREWLNETRGLELEDYADLWQWSVDELEDFWASIWEFFEVEASEPYERVLTTREMPGAEWFPGARLSYAEHVFRGRATTTSRSATPRSCGRWASGRGASCGRAPARSRARCARRASGRATASPPTSRTSPRRSPPSSAARASARPGRAARRSSASAASSTASPRSSRRCCSPSTATATAARTSTGARRSRRCSGSCRRSSGRSSLPYLAGGDWELPPAELEFAQLPFDHPLWVLYSSGTTGLPKAIVHGQGGILLEHLKKLRLHLDARAGDRLFWFTTTGWMMWNFLVGGLLSEASIVLFDGNPAHPDLGTLWDLADAAGITSFGTSAGYIAACQKAGVEPRGRPRPLAPRQRRLDRLAARARGLRLGARAARRGRLALLHLGRHRRLHRVRRRRADAAGLPRRAAGARARREGRGLERGRAPARRTRSASSSSPSRCRRCLSIYGATRTGRATARATSPRSPASGGTATGSRSPIAAPRSSPAAPTRRSTAAACAWGRASCTAASSRSTTSSTRSWSTSRTGDGSRMTLFVVLRDGAALDDGLEAEIRRRIREDCSPRHVPDEVLAAPEIPRTLSGKILEVPVKRLLMGLRPTRWRAATRSPTPKRSTGSRRARGPNFRPSGERQMLRMGGSGACFEILSPRS